LPSSSETLTVIAQTDFSTFQTKRAVCDCPDVTIRNAHYWHQRRTSCSTISGTKNETPQNWGRFFLTRSKIVRESRIQNIYFGIT